MEDSRKENDLTIIRERQDHINSQVKYLEELRGHQDRWIVWARRSGASFIQIGRALGVSKQAAQLRYDKIMAHGDPTEPKAIHDS